MSLKAFHIFFITVSILMCAGIGVVRAVAYREGGEIAALAQAGASFLAAGGLVIYGIRFLKKTKNIGYV